MPEAVPMRDSAEWKADIARYADLAEKYPNGAAARVLDHAGEVGAGMDAQAFLTALGECVVSMELSGVTPVPAALSVTLIIDLLWEISDRNSRWNDEHL